MNGAEVDSIWLPIYKRPALLRTVEEGLTCSCPMVCPQRGESRQPLPVSCMQFHVDCHMNFAFVRLQMLAHFERDPSQVSIMACYVMTIVQCYA